MAGCRCRGCPRVLRDDCALQSHLAKSAECRRNILGKRDARLAQAYLEAYAAITARTAGRRGETSSPNSLANDAVAAADEVAEATARDEGTVDDETQSTCSDQSEDGNVFDTLTAIYLFIRDADLSRREVNRQLHIFRNPRFNLRALRRWRNALDVRRWANARAPTDLVPWLVEEIIVRGPKGEVQNGPIRFFYMPDANGELVKAVPCYYAYPADFSEACRATATMQTGTKRPCTTCYVEEADLAKLKLQSTIRTPASQEHAVQQILACKTVKEAEKVQSEWSTHPIDVICTIYRTATHVHVAGKILRPLLTLLHECLHVQCVLRRWNFSDTEWGNPYGASVADTIHVLDSGVALHMIECHIDTLSKPERRVVEGRKKTTKTETPSTVLRLPGGTSYLASGANYAAFEHRAMMQVMPILVADKGALGKGPDAELRAMRVRAFRLYATFYKTFLGVDGHTRASLAHARDLAYKLVDLLPQAYPDQKSGWRFPKVHMIKHLLENVILRGMPHHYNTELWEHTHKGTVKVPVRGGNWKDIPRRIVEEEVQREICREVAADAGGGWQYTTALREVGVHFGLLCGPRSRSSRGRGGSWCLGRRMMPGAEDDAVLAMYSVSHGDDMKNLVGCMRSAGVKAESVQAHTAVAIPRTRGGALVAKGTFVKASPGEKWFSDVALLSPKGGEWFAKVLCIFKAAGDEGEPKGYMYVRYFEQAGLCPLTTCIQLTPHRKETRFAVVEVATILRVVHICRSFSNPKVLLVNKFLLIE
ncbi:unnamed protein product [Closterium sp. NIES-64]|nr:unnamed protein product [Closterium sp. NIES-64]